MTQKLYDPRDFSKILDREYALYSGAAAAQLFLDSVDTSLFDRIKPGLSKLPRRVLLDFLSFYRWPMMGSEPFVRSILEKHGDLLPSLNEEEQRLFFKNVLKPFRVFFEDFNKELTKRVARGSRTGDLVQTSLGGRTFYAVPLRAPPKPEKHSDILVASDTLKLMDAVNCSDGSLEDWYDERLEALREYVSLAKKRLGKSLVRVLGTGGFFRGYLKKTSDVDASVFLSKSELGRKGLSLLDARRILLDISHELYKKYGFFVGAPFKHIRFFENAKHGVSNLMKRRLGSARRLVPGIFSGYDLGGHGSHEEPFNSFVGSVERDLSNDDFDMRLIKGRLTDEGVEHFGEPVLLGPISNKKKISRRAVFG